MAFIEDEFADAVAKKNDPVVAAPVDERDVNRAARERTPTTTTPAGDDIPTSIPQWDDVWLDDSTGTYYLVYFTPNTEPPVPLLYEVDDTSFVFPNGIPAVGQRFSGNGLATSGGIQAGGVAELRDLGEAHPFDAIADEWEEQATIRPWMLDPEVLAVYAEAYLEGRVPTDAELLGTNWYQTHSIAEQEWMLGQNTDPVGAGAALEDQRTRVRRALEAAGINNAPDSLVNKIADNVTTGVWTPEYGTDQIALLSDPQLAGDIDPTLDSFIDSLDTTQAGEDRVRALATEWLGPALATGWNDEWFQRWAGILRNDPDGETRLVEQLRKQRLAMYPEYENAELSYEDIAGPWRQVYFNSWGQQADETDPFFGNIVRMNDHAKANQLLTQEGLKRGIQTVTNRALGDLTRSMNGSVRQADRGIL